MTENKPKEGYWKERSKTVMAQGWTGTNSKRASQYVSSSPDFTNGVGIGPYLHDSRGRKLVDFPSGLGSIILGHSNQRVVEYTQRQCAKGASFTLPTTLEVELAEMLLGILPFAHKLRFLKNGDDASRAAIRIARTYTGRSLVLSDGYHGHSDIFTSLTPPALGIKDTFQIQSLTSVDQITSDVACVIVEALKLEFTDEWASQLRSIREKCKQVGAIFIMDEIVTGFRVPNWTISNYWNIDPDMILIGKAMANGFPLSAVCGKKDLMDCGEYFISTTFSGEAVSLSACKATLIELQKRSFQDLMFYGKRLQDKLNALHTSIRFEGWGTRAMLNVTDATTALFMQEMAKAGFIFGKAHFFHYGHLEENIEPLVMSAAEVVAEKIRRNEVKLEGPLPGETFRR